VKKKLKVCFVTPQFRFFKQYIFNLAIQIASSYDVTVITDGHHVSAQDDRLLNKSNINLEQLQQRPKSNRFKLIAYIYQLNKAVNKVDPDHIFYMTIEGSFFGSLVTKFRSRRKSYFVITGIGLDYFSNKLRHRLLNIIYLLTFKANLLKKNVSYVFQNSQDQKLFLKSGFISSQNSTVIGHFGIKMTNLIKTPSKNSIKFFFAGRLVKSKGIFELLEAAKYLEKKYSNFEIIIAGPYSVDSPDSLSSSERKLLLDSNLIEYLGHIDYEQMYSLYQKFDVFVLPSYSEGLSTVALEAAANGMPLIVTDVPGCAECINNNGFLVKPRDSFSLAKAMELFLKDPNLISDFSKNSIEHIKKNYSIEIMTAAYLELINKKEDAI
jgi:glycosyltransferase involved in cell wall biosynthesis